LLYNPKRLIRFATAADVKIAAISTDKDIRKMTVLLEDTVGMSFRRLPTEMFNLP
jgi:hypothetical protein